MNIGLKWVNLNVFIVNSNKWGVDSNHWVASIYPCYCFQSPEDSIETIVGEIFQEDDKNKDGVITQDEFNHAGEDGPMPEDGIYPEDVDEENYDPTKEEL